MTILMAILIVAVQTGSQHPYLGAFLMIVFGAVSFLVGFKQYREYRILADVPRARVRSIPMGLVHLQGKATGDDRLTSPLTGLPCFYYSVKIQKWGRTQKESGWKDAGGETHERQFYLDDGTGRVLVDPQHAEYEVLRTFLGEVGARSHHTRKVHPSPGVPGPTDKELQDYIRGDYERTAAGIARLSAGDLDAAAKTPEEQAQLRVMKAAMKVMGVLQAVESVTGGSGSAGFDSGGAYRVTEHCLLADRDCIIVGTCAENPSPKNNEDRNLIRQGQNEKTFLITSETEKRIERSLRLQAFGLVFLGAALIIGAAALALHAAGML